MTNRNELEQQKLEDAVKAKGWEYAIERSVSESDYKGFFDGWVDALSGCGVVPTVEFLPELKESLDFMFFESNL